MTEKRRMKWALWLVIPAALGAGTLYWVLAREGDDRGRAKGDTEQAERANVPQNASHMAKAVELSKGRGLDAMSRVATEYGALAGDPSALSARKLLLATLFSEKDIGLKLSGVLAAVEADPTPPEKDPLWEQISSQLSELWTGEIATKGMDLVMAESRPRARRALISSFVDLATSDRLGELNPDQKQTLTETMIDVSPNLAPGQKAEVGRALRALGGNDLADIVAGKGLTGKDGHVLESERAYKDALAQTKKELEQQQGQSAAP
jgi:hypothetical protein